MLQKAKAYAAAREASAKARREIQATGHDVGLTAIGRHVIETRTVDPVTGKPGEWVTESDDHNLIVTQAESLMAQMAIGAANSAFSYIELGDPAFPATPPALSDVALQQTTGQRKGVTLTAVGNTVTSVAFWDTTEGNGFTFTEAGLFTGIIGAGIMFARKTHNPVLKDNSKQLRETWYVTFLVNANGGLFSGVTLIGPSMVVGTTVLTAAGGENSAAASFDFTVGAQLVDVFLNGVRLVPGVHYNEAASPLNAPILGAPLNKGVNLIGIQFKANDQVFFIHRKIS